MNSVCKNANTSLCHSSQLNNTGRGIHEQKTGSDSDLEEVPSPVKERIERRRHRKEDQGLKEYKKRKADAEAAGGGPKKTR